MLKEDGPSPLIFLDIDGVICCNYASELEEAKLEQLKHIGRSTGAKVVLSSDWRRRRPLKEKVQRALTRIGMEYVGCTSQRVRIERRGNWMVEQPCRPQEITEWLRRHRAEAASYPWVALDDRNLLSELGGRELEGHFVQTYFSTGLTPTLAEQAITILSKAPTQGGLGAETAVDR